MANIIAGVAETEEAAKRVIEALQAQGFGSDDVTSFYLNPPGQHATYAIGGDAHHDAGTKDAGKSFRTAREATMLLKDALEEVAGRLRNTVTMCRKCYVNPVVIDAFLAGELRAVAPAGTRGERLRLLKVLTRTPRGVTFSAPSGTRRAGSRRSRHK